MTATPQPVYLDCDTGIDDAVALAYLLASPEVVVVGIGTVSGNVSAAEAARNTIDLLHLAGHPQVPVAIGEHDPLAGAFDGGARHVHGANGLGDVQIPRVGAEPTGESAPAMLVRLAHEHSGRLRVLAIGPLTNLARALALDPGLGSRVHDVTIMGGAAMVPGNISPVAEANIGNDPEAAHAVLSAPWPITLVPLDVTMDNVMEETDRQRLVASERPLTSMLGRVLDLYFDFYVGVYGRRCSALHDPLAAALLVGGAQAAIAPRVDVVVDATDGPGRGQTICDLRDAYRGHRDQPGAHVRVVLTTQAPLREHLMERLTS